MYGLDLLGIEPSVRGSQALEYRECALCAMVLSDLARVAGVDVRSASCPVANVSVVDEGDVVTAILDIGFPTEGGSTNFYSNALNEKCKKLTYCLNFKHGHVHIGSFHSIVHSVQPSKGLRGSIVFNLKRDIVDFFETDKVPYYNMYCYLEKKKSGLKMIN